MAIRRLLNAKLLAGTKSDLPWRIGTQKKEQKCPWNEEIRAHIYC